MNRITFNNQIWRICFIFILFPLAVRAENITEIEINDLVPSDGTGTTYINTANSNNIKVTYEKKNGLSIFEGDIVLGTVQEAEEWRTAHESASSSDVTTSSVVITGQNYRWTNNLVPYQFDANLSENVKEMFIRAVNHWRDNTTIDFVERTSANASSYPDYVKVIDKKINGQNVCWSYVGKRGGEQELNVALACGFGSTVHEIGHAVGLWHEQSRNDRDSFIQINWSNIKSTKEHNFCKVNNPCFNYKTNFGDDFGAYDYGSIMHYGAYAFSNNGQPTIEPLQSGVTLGQRNGLSQLDIAAINAIYPYIAPPSPPPTTGQSNDMTPILYYMILN